MKKAKKRTVVDRVIIIACTMIVVICFACMIVLFRQDQKNGAVTANGKVEMVDGTYKTLAAIYAEYNGGVCYTGTYLNVKSITVYGIYTDGTKKVLEGWDGVIGPVREGNNSFQIKYGDMTTQLNVFGFDINNVTGAINHNIYAYDAQAANKLISKISSGSMTYDDAFENVLMCGDSRTLAIASFQVLDKEKVLAENGVGLQHLEDHMSELLSRNPGTVILNYGVNSMTTSSEAREQFVKDYKAAIQKIQEALPYTRIIVAAIFPVRDDFTYIQPRMKYIDEVNLSLFRMCAEMNIEFINGSYLLNNNTRLYLDDGLHFSEEFYKDYWMDELILQMGIGTVEISY